MAPTFDSTQTANLAATEQFVFAAGMHRPVGLADCGLAIFSTDDGHLITTAYPNRWAYSVAANEDVVYTGFGFLAGKYVERMFLPTFAQDTNWNPAFLGGEQVVSLTLRANDFLVGCDFESFAGSPGSGIALIPALDGPPVVT